MLSKTQLFLKAFFVEKFYTIVEKIFFYTQQSAGEASKKP
jgi:hypothetical protein